jgi:ankyrin repeat protein
MNDDNKLLIFTVPVSSNMPHPIYGTRHLPNAPKATNVLTAALEGNLNLVLQFVKKGNIDIQDEDGYTPLHNAVSRKHHEVARVLIPLISINQQSKSGFTPLMNAAAYGDNKMVTMLLENGADVGLRNVYGETAYDVAAIGNLIA